jgi:ribulose-phosphate 3-epimerase
MKYTSKPLDIHLMVEDVNPYLLELNTSNIEYITIHYEVLNDINLIQKIKNNHIKCGISIKPNTDIKNIFPLLETIDLVLIMSVEPGFGGQSFIDNTLSNIKVLKEEITRKKLKTLISVDGGINDIIAKQCIENGTDILVVGTYITESNNYQEKINSLKK